MENGYKYPRATIIKEATSTYNCHAYAWHMTQGGTPTWMGLSSNPTDGSTIIEQIYNQIRVKFTKPGTYVVTCSSGSPCTGPQSPIANIVTVTQSDLR